jgi:hypothetical protein
MTHWIDRYCPKCDGAFAFLGEAPAEAKCDECGVLLTAPELYSPLEHLKTWTIRDQMPNGSWGPAREVTLAEFLAEHKAKSQIALQKHRANVATIH